MKEALVSVENLKKYFPTKDKDKTVKAVDGITFDIYRGETLGVVGESGCGKSTTGRLVLRLLDATEGTVRFKGQDLGALRRAQVRALRKQMQFVFQDPYASLDPRKTVMQTLSEPFQIHDPHMPADEMQRRVRALVERVGLRPEHILRYPHEFSGGQRQRIGIARAIALNPEFVVCDEPVSALDVSIQAQVINLMMDIKKEFHLTYLFISHDLRIIKHLCDRVMVMYLGNIVEIGEKRSIYAVQRHPYTQALLSAIPNIRARDGRERILLAGDLPSPINPPTGCPFHPRCAHRIDICAREKPALRTLPDGTRVACHLPFDGENG